MKPLILILLTASAACAQEPAVPDHPPRHITIVELEPAAWYTSPGGTVRLPGGSGEADLSSLNLDSPRLSPFVEVRVRRGELSLELSGFGYSASDRGAMSTGLSLGPLTIPAGARTIASLDTGSFEAALGYTIHEFHDDHDGRGVDLTLDLTGGIRAHTVDLTLSSGGTTIGDDALWAEPTAGLFLRADIAEEFSIDLDISLGAMVLEDYTAISWDVLVGLSWRPTDAVGVLVGYRQLAFALEEGGSGNDFQWRGAMAGVYAGVTIDF